MTIEEHSKFFQYHDQLKLIRMYGKVKFFLCYMKNIYNNNNVRKPRYLDHLINSNLMANNSASIDMILMAWWSIFFKVLDM